mgnify:CR=1 FL=1
MTDNIKKKLLGKYGEDYVRALIFTSSAEGAFANRKADKGGITYKGISQVYNPKWVGWNIINRYLDKYPELKTPYEGKPPASIHKLNFELNANEELEALIYDFYYENYWKKCGADRIGGKLAVILFDISVLMGCHRASKTLQKVANRYFGCNLVVDGIVGSGTISKVKELIQTKGEDIFVSNMLLEYGDNVTEASKLEGNAKFLQGWMNRISHLSNYLRKL